nr:MAG TPA: hypothetical protein [Caudoviricetes sp.]
MRIIEREELDHIPYDKMFTYEGNMTFCHATGYEALIEIGAEKTWWNEYELPDGSLVYGR